MFAVQIVKNSQGEDMAKDEQFVNFGHSRREFDTGKAAAEFATELNQLSHNTESAMRYRVFKIDMGDHAANLEWRAREAARFDSGDYLPVPWYQESWFHESSYANLHFAHMSTDKPGLIAFTESDDKGIADKQLRLRAGKYLSRFFSDTLNNYTINRFASKVYLETGKIEVKFATTPDEIEHIYRNGPGACMSYDARHFDTNGVHPSRVYGAGDLAIAYMVTGGESSDDTDDSDSYARGTSITARAVCWPDKQIFASIYGDGGEYATRFESMLESLGFSDASYHEFDGARILKISCGSGGSYVCPYLDIADSVSDAGEFLQIGGGDYSANNTNGTCGEGHTCDHCNDCYSPEDGGGYIEGYGEYCDSCYSELSIFCGDCEDYGHRNHATYIDSINDWKCDSCASDYPTCESCDKQYPSDDIYISESGDTVCSKCIENGEYVNCEDCGELHDSSDIKTRDGDSLCDSCLEKRIEDDSSDCEECGKLTLNEDLTESDAGLFSDQMLCDSCYANSREAARDESSYASRLMATLLKIAA